MTPTAKRRTGRRPGRSGTREAIAQAARRQFGEHGYERTTLRGVAQEAGVDPAWSCTSIAPSNSSSWR